MKLKQKNSDELWSNLINLIMYTDSDRVSGAGWDEGSYRHLSSILEGALLVGGFFYVRYLPCIHNAVTHIWYAAQNLCGSLREWWAPMQWPTLGEGRARQTSRLQFAADLAREETQIATTCPTVTGEREGWPDTQRQSVHCVGVLLRGLSSPSWVSPLSSSSFSWSVPQCLQ